MREVQYTQPAIRTLRKMPANTSALITLKIEAFAKNPEAGKDDVKMLKGREGFRLLVCDWRVIMDERKSNERDAYNFKVRIRKVMRRS
jgi:mRNA interferase RelE/StbE